MLLSLAFLYFFHSSISAAPVSHVLRDTISPDLNSSCVCPDQQRSFWDILWSCLATIFACTWVSVHPNIPPSGEKWWKTCLRRVELMFWALIAPELMILWAMRQWYDARGMVKKYYGHRWTKTHAYFIQMGGFTLFRGGEPQRVLLPGEMEDLLLDGKIDLPQITEEEIRDRSKGDGLSKALVIGQTSWFIAQCVARRAQGLILTELELVTAALAALNGVMYFLWWNKPLDVRCSVPVPLLGEVKPEDHRFKFISSEKSSLSIWEAMLFLYYRSKATFVLSVTGIRESIKDINVKAASKVMTTIVVSPWTVVWIFFSRLDDITTYGGRLEGAGLGSAVTTFYASPRYTPANTVNALIPSVTSAIAVLFGSLHCAGWFFEFPSHAESIIWRVCSALISIIPLSLLSFFLIDFCEDNTNSNSRLKKPLSQLVDILLCTLFFLPIYAIARLILLGEAFAALRFLPPDALAVVDWLSFLPHI